MNALQFQKKLLSMQENMMNFALMLTANRDDAQDLMQDTTLKVLDNIIRLFVRKPLLIRVLICIIWTS